MSRRDRSQLLRDLKAAFPEITSELNAAQGRLHFEVDVFRRFAQRAICAGDRERAAQCFSLAAHYLADGNPAVRDAIDVSFVEPLEFDSTCDDRRWAWDDLPATLKKAYVAFHGKAPM